MEAYDSLKDSSMFKADLKAVDEIITEQFEPKLLLERHGVMSIIAMTGSGKTVFIIDCLSIVHNSYDHIFMISKTARLQKCYSFFEKTCIKDNFDEDFLRELWEANKSAVLLGQKPKNILLIFDDVLNDRKVRNSVVMDDLFSGGRHVNISMWCLSHNFTTLKPLQRNNTSWFVSFDLDSVKERENLAGQYLSTINKRVGMMLFKKIVTEKPFQCIVIINHKNGAGNSKIKKYIANVNPRSFKIKDTYKPANEITRDIKTTIKPTRSMRD